MGALDFNRRPDEEGIKTYGAVYRSGDHEISTADLMKKGLRLVHKVLNPRTGNFNRRPDEEGIKTLAPSRTPPLRDFNRRPDEEGIKTRV